MTVAAILKQKGREVICASPTLLASDLARLLHERRIGAVLVQDAAGRLLGIVSERDLVSALALHGAQALSLTAAQIMTAEVETVTPSCTVEEAMAIMTVRRFRHLPVMADGRLAGLISIGDVVKARITQQEHEVDSLKAYVAGAA